MVTGFPFQNALRWSTLGKVPRSFPTPQRFPPRSAARADLVDPLDISELQNLGKVRAAREQARIKSRGLRAPQRTLRKCDAAGRLRRLSFCVGQVPVSRLVRTVTPLAFLHQEQRVRLSRPLFTPLSLPDRSSQVLIYRRLGPPTRQLGTPLILAGRVHGCLYIPDSDRTVQAES